MSRFHKSCRCVSFWGAFFFVLVSTVLGDLSNNTCFQYLFRLWQQFSYYFLFFCQMACCYSFNIWATSLIVQNGDQIVFLLPVFYKKSLIQDCECQVYDIYHSVNFYWTKLFQVLPTSTFFKNLLRVISKRKRTFRKLRWTFETDFK